MSMASGQQAPGKQMPGQLMQMDQASGHPLYSSEVFSIYPDKVIQGNYQAQAVSATHLKSNYVSPSNINQSSLIEFKFAINGKDNEMAYGINHKYNINDNGLAEETPLITFGKPLKLKDNENSVLKPGTSLKFRLDMREMHRQFDAQGYYTTFNGTQIYLQDFKGVYIAGSVAPMTWDFDNLVNNPQLQLFDKDGDGIYEVTLELNKPTDKKETASEWKLSKDLSKYPQLVSGYALSDAIYNLSLEEMLRAIEPDSTFRTGQEWSGVWTRDISYSIILSMAHMQPAVSVNSLMRKVNPRKRIIQDTGTGGAWPVSIDRMIWAVAAWEVYKVTGSRSWLEQSYEIIKNSVEDDLRNVYDDKTGLFKGESSFLDWRDQTYPKWMQPADIFESLTLGTNAVHFQANSILAQMADLLGHKDVAIKHRMIAAGIKDGINTFLWLPDKKYYAQYLYGRTYKIVSPRAEALGEALCVLFGIADKERAKELVQHTPVAPFGIPCINPQIPDIPPYHNNGIWPFVQSYWLLAGAKTANEQSVLHSIASIYRPAALWLTNKENFVAETGDFNGTQINSSIMLWSISGNVSLVHKVLFGINFEPDSLSFEPFVPQSLSADKVLRGFKYREAILDIEVKGWGNTIVSFEMDGKEQPLHKIPSTLKGHHSIKLRLSNTPADQSIVRGEANMQKVKFTLPYPKVSAGNNSIHWSRITGAGHYVVLANGNRTFTTSDTIVPVTSGLFTEYQVIAVDDQGMESFASEPVVMDNLDKEFILQAEDFAPKSTNNYLGYTGKGFVEISKLNNTEISFKITSPYAGHFAVDFRYANGNGPSNTDNKCAVRTLKVNGKTINSMVFPQRGKDEWSNWGYSNTLTADLPAGLNTIDLTLERENENMDGKVNQAMIDHIRLRLIKQN